MAKANQKNLRQKLIEGAFYTEDVVLEDYDNEKVTIHPILDTQFMAMLGDAKETFHKLNTAGISEDADFDDPEVIKAVADIAKSDQNMMDFMMQLNEMGIVKGQGLHDVVQVPDFDAGVGPNGEMQMKDEPVYKLFGRFASIEIALRILDITMPRKGQLANFSKRKPGTASSSHFSSGEIQTTSDPKEN